MVSCVVVGGNAKERSCLALCSLRQAHCSCKGKGVVVYTLPFIRSMLIVCFDVRISGRKKQGRSVLACGLLQIRKSHGTGERTTGVSKPLASVEIGVERLLRFMITD